MIFALAAHAQWWEAVAALGTPAVAVCSYIARKARQLGDHLERQDLRGRQQSRRLKRLEENAGLPPLPKCDEE